MAKKGLVNELTLYIYKFISDNYKGEGVCLLLDGEDKTLKRKGRSSSSDMHKIDVIHDGSIVGKIQITSTSLYFIFAYPGSEEVEIDFLPLIKRGDSPQKILAGLKFVVRNTLAVNLEKSIGIMDSRANPRRNNPVASSLGAIAMAGIAGFMIGKK